MHGNRKYNMWLPRLQHISVSSHYCAYLVYWRIISDFIDDVKCNTPVKYIIKVNTVIEIGTTIQKFVDANGKYLFLPCISYHLPTTDALLFSPQKHHQLHGSHSIIKGLNVQMALKKHNSVIPINIQEPNTWITNDISGFSQSPDTMYIISCIVKLHHISSVYRKSVYCEWHPKRL